MAEIYEVIHLMPKAHSPDCQCCNVRFGGVLCVRPAKKRYRGVHLSGSEEFLMSHHLFPNVASQRLNVYSLHYIHKNICVWLHWLSLDTVRDKYIYTLSCCTLCLRCISFSF